MRFKEWSNKTSFTLGAELEIRFCDKKSKKLSYCADSVKQNLPKKLKKYVHDEFSPCLLEIVTPICQNAQECVDFLQKSTKIVSKKAKAYNANTIASGIYPASHEDFEILEKKRYRSIKDEFGILLSDFSICGLHLHVGFCNNKEALKAYNLLINYSPIFICLLANSPFFNFDDTKLLSYRLSVFDRLSRSGISPYFSNYKKMQDEYERYFNAKIIKSQNDIWWDLRIKPEFGTLELRIGDSVSDMKRLKVAIMLYQALCLYAQNSRFTPLPLQILKQNRYNAIRYGFDGYMYESKRVTFREFTHNLIKKMQKKGVFERLNLQNEVPLIKEHIDKLNPAQMQLKLYKNSKNFDRVLDFGVIK